MLTDLITKVYFNEHLTHSCVGMPQGLQALLSSLYRKKYIPVNLFFIERNLYWKIIIFNRISI